MESILSYPTKCRLPLKDGTPCKFTLTDAPMNIPVIGEQPDSRILRYMEALMKHVAKKHPEAFTLANLHGQMFFGYLTTGNFEVIDPAMIDMRKKFEDTLRRYATPAAVTDQEIESALAAMQFTMEDPQRDKVKFAMQHLRDYYEGKVQLQPQSPLITP
jgi:hypothetical protein